MTEQIQKFVQEYWVIIALILAFLHDPKWIQSLAGKLNVLPSLGNLFRKKPATPDPGQTVEAMQARRDQSRAQPTQRPPQDQLDLIAQLVRINNENQLGAGEELLALTRKMCIDEPETPPAAGKTDP